MVVMQCRGRGLGMGLAPPLSPPRPAPEPLMVVVRPSHLLPPTQYDIPISKKFNMGYCLKTYWETIPLFLVTCTSLGILFFSIIWACKNKVDVVFESRSRENISRTMDLRNPSIHKLRIINQRYDPWPEMQDALEKIKAAEKRLAMRLKPCLSK
ncbi:uncharacterized protein LOC126367622 [Pectinophora gossypiella]|uniref:uncharacterized protein LOC126367622 n=1 Tax=Pectinophora gossypiella TaxID=13191 RepID=UPI00214E6D7B|nr:uncharacterized protein LOC126367622 [Pectinophora gossypiella]